MSYMQSNVKMYKNLISIMCTFYYRIVLIRFLDVRAICISSAVEYVQYS